MLFLRTDYLFIPEDKVTKPELNSAQFILLYIDKKNFKIKDKIKLIYTNIFTLLSFTYTILNKGKHGESVVSFKCLFYNELN